MRSISAAEARRHFSALLREVSRGVRITVTSRGKAVAIISAADQVQRHARVAAKRALLSRLRATAGVGSRNWLRDDLYE